VAIEDTHAGRAAADHRFAAIAVRAGFVSPADLDSALAEQDRRRAEARSRPKGEVAVRVPRLGEILAARGLLTREQADRLLKVQLQRFPTEARTPFGEIAVARRFIGQDDLDEAIDRQEREVLASGRVRDVREILLEMGVLSPAAAEAILAYQARADSVPMAELRKAVKARGPAPQRMGGGAGPAPSLDEPSGPLVDRPRPVFLPKGARGFVTDNAIWLAAAATTLIALALVLLKGTVFG